MASHGRSPRRSRVPRAATPACLAATGRRRQRGRKPAVRRRPRVGPDRAHGPGALAPRRSSAGSNAGDHAALARSRAGSPSRCSSCRLVDVVASEMRSGGWDVLAEWTFSHFGERGSIDLVGWHDPTSAMVVVEVKSRVVDVQALLSSVDRKARLAPRLLALERGWRPESVGRLLVLPGGSTSRDALARHPASLGAAFPDRNVAVRRWLRSPSGPMAGVLFIRDTARGGAPARRSAHQATRVRAARSENSLQQIGSADPTVGRGIPDEDRTKHRSAR